MDIAVTQRAVTISAEAISRISASAKAGMAAL
jgi:hypothetical protein